MKTYILICLIFVSGRAIGQESIRLDEIGGYIGKEVRVCAKVAGTHKTNGNKKIVFLNIGKPYPDAPLLAVIFEDDFKNFAYAPEQFLDQKNICITGKLVLYNGKPEFIIKHEKQIEVE